MSSKFDFYEVVRVRAECVRVSHLRHQEGVVLGMAQGESNQWHYTVSMNNSDVCYIFMEHELEPMEQSLCEENFFDGTRIQVKVDPVTGEGSINDVSGANNG